MKCHPGFAAREDRDPSAPMSDNTYWVYILSSRFRGTLSSA